MGRNQKMKTSNPWKVATIVLGIIFLMLIVQSIYEDRNEQQTDEEIITSVALFADNNNLTNACDLESGICCDMIKRVCWNSLK